MVALMIHSCHNIETLYIECQGFGEEGEPEEFLNHLADLYDALDKHPSLQKVTLQVQTETLRRLGPALIAIPNLKTCCLRGKHSRERLEIVSLEDVEVIRNILSNPGLELFALECASFADEEMVLGACDVIRRSHIIHLEASEWNFPESMTGNVASLLTCSEHIGTLNYSSPCTLGIFEAFSAALANAPSNLQSFYTLAGRVQKKDYPLEALLRHADQWKIMKLALTITEWTDSFEIVLAKYISTTHFLKTLSLELSYDYDATPLVASLALITAIRSGSRSLDHVTFHTRPGDAEPSYEWLLHLEHALKRNRQRQPCSSILQSNNETQRNLISVLKMLDSSVLYEYLCDDEVNLQTLVVRYGGSTPSSCLSPSGKGSARKRRGCAGTQAALQPSKKPVGGSR
jgi:hypothetical protein